MIFQKIKIKKTKIELVNGVFFNMIIPFLLKFYGFQDSKYLVFLLVSIILLSQAICVSSQDPTEDAGSEASIATEEDLESQTTSQGYRCFHTFAKTQYVVSISCKLIN